MPTNDVNVPVETGKPVSEGKAVIIMLGSIIAATLVIGLAIKGFFAILIAGLR
jgi:hypothetical protein